MRIGALVSSCVFVGVVGCGGAKGSHALAPNELTADQIDADPMALLPASPVAVANVDARAFYASGTLGAQLASVSEKVIPLGDDAGFNASRDVDRVVAATYSSQGADVVAVVSGRFDEAKIEAAAQAQAAKGASAIAESEYAGHHVFTVNGTGFTILTPKTALAGTQAAMRRALDRVQDGKNKREIAQWMQDTLATPSAAAAIAVDFTQPLTSAAVGSFQISFVKGLKTVRAVADFKPPGMHLAGTLTYVDAASAASASSGMKAAATMESLVAMTGLAPKLHDVSVSANAADVEVSLAVDDQAMRKMIAILPQMVH
jgi:hypothetical protein